MASVEDHRVVDVLPTRKAGPLADWLIRHPGVEIIFRDRAAVYAEGAQRGAPGGLHGPRCVTPQRSAPQAGDQPGGSAHVVVRAT